ncbi:MAG: HAD family hydrolase [Melioribacteraceae bacterium]
MLSNKKVLLLDMNSTFMFGEDRFDESEDFSIHYHKLGGKLQASEVNKIIRSAFDYIDVRYPDEQYRNNFPSVKTAMQETSTNSLSKKEMETLIDTFAFHELGHIPNEYLVALQNLHKRFTLAAVIDIWSPKKLWVELFEELGIMSLFNVISFSSDHGMVKPSPKPFELVMGQLEISSENALMIGDSARRDLGGANTANIDCVLVGGASSPKAICEYKNLLEFCDVIGV